MELLTGINHVAVVTGDLDRLIDFYTEVFDAELAFVEATPDFRHALLRVGGDSMLHPFEMKENPHTSGKPAMFERGHLDHVALTVASEEALFEIRGRLVERGAADGSITDFGPVWSVWYEDPDGMGSEVVWVRDRWLVGLHGPRSLAVMAS